MKIYTRTGDNGTTGLLDGTRVFKSDIQIEACGSADELSSIVGIIVSETLPTPTKNLLLKIQNDLYHLMSFLSGGKLSQRPITKHIKLIEQKIDKETLGLSKINRFILPQGTRTAALLHLARAVCRRTERRVVLYFKEKKSLANTNCFLVLSYLNRLSDLFFTLARASSKTTEITVS